MCAPSAAKSFMRNLQQPAPPAASSGGAALQPASSPSQPAAIKGPWGLDMKYMGNINNSPVNAASPIANALSKGMIGRVVR